MTTKRLLMTIITLILLTFPISSCSNDTKVVNNKKGPLYTSSYITNNPSAKSESNNSQSYDSYLDFPYYNMSFADDKIFKIIKNAYNKVNFYGKFKKGSLSKYGFYKKKFNQLLKNEVAFIDKDTGKKAYLKDFNPLKVYNGEKYLYDLNSYKFYFFDFDEDNTPELCISNKGNTYIFKYKNKLNKLVLIYKMEGGYLSLIGSNKIAWDNEMGAFPVNAFYELKNNENLLCSVTFYSKQDNNSIYMVSLPQYINSDSQIKITEELKNKAYFDEGQKLYYFRVTEEQFVELTKDYFNAVELADKNINDVTFSYNELFGNLD